MYCRDTGNTKKYGETTRGEDRFGAGNQKRYTKQELQEMNARYRQINAGTKKDMYKQQNKLNERFEQKHGRYPEYNKNGR